VAKHDSGPLHGATENTTAVNHLQQDSAEDSLARVRIPRRRYLSAIDTAKSWRAAIDHVFRGRAQAQRRKFTSAGT
jgi:hypothetical protein